MKIVAYYKKQPYDVIIDDEDFSLIQNMRINLIKHRKGRVRPILYFNSKFIDTLGRFILKAPPKQTVDHINGNPLDNRKENLRFITVSANIQNTGPTIKNSTGYKGVDFMPKLGKYRARINVMYKNIHLGVFSNAEDAAKAYNIAAVLHFGDKAWVNKV